ncbi:uncharacterized protein LOC129742784 [Uranotaenia lowii]|uniref:uncharacterized protein LOC129742784 n=1 Tax=Uranotaenia lowii TaxID=190385 RepID=UPI0024793D5F|nr:uncharacterized protein LOC129742784 [Uranotaenia lowii]
MATEMSSSDYYNTIDLENAFSCVACDKPDSADNVVACDRCSNWWHFSCAGVGADIKHQAWVCAKCLPTKTASNRSSPSVRRAKLELELKRVEEEQELDKRYLAKRYQVMKDLVEEDDSHSSRSQEIELPKEKSQRTANWVASQTHSDTEGAVGGQIPRDIQNVPYGEVVTRKEEQCQKPKTVPTLQQQLRAWQGNERPSVMQLQELQNQFNLCRLALTPPAIAQQQLETASFPPAEKRDEPIYPPKQQLVPTTTTVCSSGAMAQSAKAPLFPQPVLPTISERSENSEERVNQQLPEPAVPVTQVEFPVANVERRTNTLAPGPSKSQAAARQVLPRDLPPFSGDPVDWPVFIIQYNYTTEACGFSEGENMIRLQRCLKGAAWEAVRSRLILPASVPRVIQELRMRFGRPDLLVHSLIERVKATPSPKADRLETLIEFGTVVQALCDHIIAAELTDHLANPSLLKDLIGKLPTEYQMRWASYRRVHEVVNLQTFGAFMEEVVTDAYSVTTYSAESKRHPTRREKHKVERSFVHSDTGGSSAVNPRGTLGNSQRTIACAVCQKLGHRARDCRTFQQLSVDERWKRIQELALCRTCLYAHGRRPCNNRNRCGVNGCSKRHHPLLHQSVPPKPSNNTPSSSPSETVSHHSTASSLLYRIIPIVLYNGNSSVDTFAFIDEGSSLTMIETELADKLGLNGRKQPLCLKWTSNVTRVENESKRVGFSISGAGQTKRYPLVNLLIGLDNLKLVVPLKAREGGAGDPTAVRTRLGWCVYGGTRDDQTPTISYHVCECQDETPFDEAAKRFFAVEEEGTKVFQPIVSDEDKRAIKILKDTTKRVGDRFESGLLWRYDYVEFPDSYAMCFGRLQCLERKMLKDPLLRESITRQIREYQQKGYCHRATPSELDTADVRRTWYLPLGAVTNPKKPGKVRLIWDAAARVDGISLNTLLLKGPDQLTSLPAVLFRFRQHPVAVSGDIKEMYHQIRIREEDRSAQRFLWRDDPDVDPEIFVMDFATFGSSCSPATAQFVKNTNAQQFIEEYPDAVENIISGHYVDDYVASFRSIEQAQRITSQVKEIHLKGGFELRNFCSNCPQVVEHLGEMSSETIKDLNPGKGEASERVLGIIWDTAKDEFRFPMVMRDDMAFLIQNKSTPTKRQILRYVMTMFDPLGLLAPYLIFGKIIIQEAWRKKLGWDEPVDDDTCELWHRWVEMLKHINNIGIQRSYFSEAPQNIEIHTFVDASEVAYSCAVYFRYINSRGGSEVALVAAKTKVAPLKPWTIPRLEIQGCVLGARLTQFVVQNHSLRVTRRCFWTDSSTALSWILEDPRKYHRFVAFRVAEILELTNRNEWRWVPSKQNPADEATKWGSGPFFKVTSIWYSGPEFLRLSEDRWPVSKVVSTTEEELRACYSHHDVPFFPPVIDYRRFSKWCRILRTTAYVHRYIANRQLPPERRNLGCLTRAELQKAERSLFMLAQREAYPDEVVTLKRNLKLPKKDQICIEKSSRIYQLTPSIDEYGVLRLDGRIAAVKGVKKDAKFPVILPKEHWITFLYIDELHRRFHHANNETVVNEARQRIHVPALRSLVRTVAKKCQQCAVYKARPAIPRMAPLPVARLSSQVRPFSNVGLDYFGPLMVRVGRSNVKRWVALFTCLTVRAVHLEPVHSLTTESCIAAIRRFIGRRGAPAEVHSDNGTNFQGAEKILRQQINSGVEATFTNTTTTWHFIPPAAPHMGGAWERMVRSVKQALLDAYHDKLDDEKLQTLLVEAESIVNSRPLTYLPLDSAESEAITPNHFLLGSSDGVCQPIVETECSSKLLSYSWSQLQKQLNTFWKRWTLEYLPTLTKRTKWFGETKPIEAGALVVLVEGSRRNGWTRGRVLQLITNPDGRCRQALVQTRDGVFRRPLSRLAVLEVGDGCGTESTGFHRGEDVAARVEKTECCL